MTKRKHEAREEAEEAPQGGGALRCIRQPKGIFYKDEGGKANFLCAQIQLSSRFAAPQRVEYHLYYENCRLVEDEEEIMNVLSVSPPNQFISGTKKFEVKWRLEKVSRRKDGRRFRLGFHLGEDGQEPEVFTAPICVLSKRKLNTRQKKAKAKRLETRTPRGGTRDRSSAAALAAQQRLMERLVQAEQRIEELTARVAELERRPAASRLGAGAGSGARSLGSFRSSCDEEDAEGEPVLSEVSPAGPVPLHLGCGDERNLMSPSASGGSAFLFGDSKQIRLGGSKRLIRDMMHFNFGPPGEPSSWEPFEPLVL